MMVPSLFYLARSKVAENFLVGKYVGLNFTLPSEIGEQVYDVIEDKTESISEKLAASMGQQLPMDFLEVTENWNKFHYEFLKNQNAVKKLNITTYSFCEKDAEGNLQFAKGFEKIVNAQSRLTLNSLVLAYVDVPFENDWPRHIGMMLPNLTRLDISESPFDDEQFNMMTMSFPNLITLDITACVILETLEGISRLTKLRVLKMGGVIIDKKEGYMDLCKMSSLNVIVVTPDALNELEAPVFTLSDAVEELAASGIDPLPNVTLIDANLSLIDADDCQIFTTHLKSLKQIWLLGTSLEYSNDIATDRVEVINFATLESSIKALGQKFRDLKKSAVDAIVSHHLQSIDTAHLDDMEWRKKAILSVGKVSDEICLKEYYTKCSMIIKSLCNTQTLRYLTDNYFQQIVYRFRNYDRREEMIDYLANYWHIFSNDAFLQNYFGLEDIQYIVKEGLKTISEPECAALFPHIFKFLQNVFLHRNYIDDVVIIKKDEDEEDDEEGEEEKEAVTFLEMLYSEEAKNDNRVHYLAKLSVTLAAVERSQMICRQFREMRMPDISERERAEFADDLKINEMQQRIEKIVSEKLMRKRFASPANGNEAKRRPME